MPTEFSRYWNIHRDYAGVPFIRLDREKMIKNLGSTLVSSLLNFTTAHELFNDPENPPNEEEKKNLIAIMVEARGILGDLNPYLFIDSAMALEKRLAQPQS